HAKGVSYDFENSVDFHRIDGWSHGSFGYPDLITERWKVPSYPYWWESKHGPSGNFLCFNAGQD
ncbi:MAG: hypothetical protein ACOCV9_01575, partial [Marinilabiliaceae bacterium]